MPVVDCRDLYKRYGERVILEGAALTVRRGERVGLLGRSGCGKSTLGRLLAGLESPDAGEISRRRGARIDLLEQTPVFDAGSSVREIVLRNLADWNAARARYAELTDALGGASASDAKDLARAQAAAADDVERLGGWDRVHEAEAILDHLGIQDPDRLVDTLSGGECRRVALARILIAEPDLAILDEPTNHLDVATIEWLETHLQKRFRGAVLIITHDRYVLDRVATRTLELHAGSVAAYEGGYASYLTAKAEREAHAERVERNRQNFLRRELEWLRRGPKARGTKQKARIQRAHDAIETSAPLAEPVARFRADATKQGRTILEIRDLVLSRGGRTLVRSLDLALSQGDRIGIIGPNGIGKTSLLLCLKGGLEPESGAIAWGARTQIGVLDQERSGLDPTATLREAVLGEREVVHIGDDEIRGAAYLEQFLFDGTAQRSKVAVLSGGERSRACLAKLLCEKSNLLLLDEPTNDLDVSTLGALEAMLIDYPGSALIVSHDRWFLDRVATAILAFEADGRVDLLRGGYSDYVAVRATEAEAARRAEAERAPREVVRSADPPAGSASGPKKLTFKERQELEALPDRIEAADAEVRSLEEKLADPATYQRRDVDLSALTAALEPARERAKQLLDRWEELEERRELTTVTRRS